MLLMIGKGIIVCSLFLYLSNCSRMDIIIQVRKDLLTRGGRITYNYIGKNANISSVG